MLKMHNRYLRNDRGIDIIEGNLERVKKKHLLRDAISDPVKYWQYYTGIKVNQIP